MSFTLIELTGTVEVPNGTTVVGVAGATITLTLSTPVTDGVSQLEPNPVVITCNGSGAIPSGTYVPANDDSTTTPTGSAYKVQISNASPAINDVFYVVVPHASYPSVDLFSLARLGGAPSSSTPYVISVNGQNGVVTVGAGSANVEVLGFSFSYSLSGLTAGVAFYTPTVGDILLDAWFEIDTAWNGTTPLGDIGQFLSGNSQGFFGAWGEPPTDMTSADGATNTDTLLWGQVSGVGSGGSSDLAKSITAEARGTPAKFTTTDPLKVVVSQTGQTGGASPASSAGSAVIFLKIAHAPTITAL